VRAEIAAAQKTVKSSWLDIDGIEHLTDQAGVFVYRLTLSSPVNFSPDQTLTFQTRKPADTVPAIVLRCDDEGLVADCQTPLPTAAKLLSVPFDPAFILRALEAFVSEMAPRGGPLSRLVIGRSIPASGPVRTRPHPTLDEDQSAAVEGMAETPLHLLWGPPGT